MFFSTHLLIKNGKFAVVWRVAKDAKRVKKEEVIKISVPLKCKELKECEIPLALRLQAELANGIVKIFGYQVDYLFEDAVDAKIRLNDMGGGVDLLDAGEKEGHLQDVNTLDFLQESFHVELEQKLAALGDMNFDEMRKIVSASKSLDRGEDPNRVEQSFELNMSIDKIPKPMSKFEDSFEDFNNVGDLNVFDFLDAELPEVIREQVEGALSMDFDETVVLSKEKDPKEGKSKKADSSSGSIEESGIAAPEVSRVNEEEPSDRMEVEEKKDDELEDKLDEDNEQKEEEKVKEKKVAKARRRGKKRKWRDAKPEMSDAQIQKQFDTVDELVRDYDTYCWSKPPPTKKNMREFRQNLPVFLAQSRMSLGSKLQEFFSTQYTKMLEGIKENEQKKLEDELNATFEEILSEPPPDPSEPNPDPLSGLSDPIPDGSNLLTIPSSQNQSITIIEDSQLELPSVQLDFGSGDDISSDSDREKGSQGRFVLSTQTREMKKTLLEYVEENENGDEGASFFGFAKGKSRREVVSMFVSTVILKSKGKLDVEQPEPYGDIKITSPK